MGWLMGIGLVEVRIIFCRVDLFGWYELILVWVIGWGFGLVGVVVLKDWVFDLVGLVLGLFCSILFICWC